MNAGEDQGKKDRVAGIAFEVYQECAKIVLRYIGHLDMTSPTFVYAADQAAEAVGRHLDSMPVERAADFATGALMLELQLSVLKDRLMQRRAEEIKNFILEKRRAKSSSAGCEPGE